ncbi:TonB-dependent siderophore receptor [Sphingorhabdus sp. 109]|jgi:iron complex outermembrane receptor protein|uniref:TonB-dependent siderophore receptor n=1 Tax=Sphingorhabdus sp. 109 TaxID=2653173 RepID=UPI001356BDE9|nr:TonB-dependent siderophore receptor [Sphingorhabdus sp. 109]
MAKEAGDGPANERQRNKDRQETLDSSEILVTGRMVNDYVASDALTGTKNAALLMDTPSTVVVVSEELIEDRGLVRLDQALDTVSGAQPKAGYGGTQNFGTFLRGFDLGQVTLRDGFRDPGFYSLRNTANVERFEVLKGPASVLYGAINPGGIVNTITKQPKDEAHLDAVAILGSFDFYRAEIDAGTPLTQGINLRLNAAYEDSDSYRDLVESRSLFVAPAVSLQLGDKTRWLVRGEYTDSQFTWDIGLPRIANSLRVPVSRFLGEEDGINDVQSYFVSSLLEHDISSDWRIRQNISYSRTSGEYNLRSFYAVDADDRTVLRVAYDTDESQFGFIAQHEVIGDFRLAGIRNQFAAGLEHYTTGQEFAFEFQNLDNIDLFTPVYGAVAGDQFAFPLFSSDNDRDGTALYAQNLMHLSDSFKLLAGIRQEWIDNRDYDRLADAETRNNSDKATSPQIGLLFQPAENTSLFGSYSSSFTPSSARQADGTFLDPETGEQFEIGWKQVWLNGRITLSLAGFEITKSNVATPDPDNPAFNVQSGKQRSRGVEMDIAANPVPGLAITFAAAHIDAEVTEDSRFLIGAALPGAPKWSGSLWSRYRFEQGPLDGFTFGLGLFYSGKREALLRTQAAPADGFLLPSYTRLDAMVGYEKNGWRVQVNAGNLTNEKIYLLSGTALMPQASRNFAFRVGRSF